MEYHRDDRYLSEIEVLLVLDKGPADAQFHEGHSHPVVTPCARMRSRGIVFCCQFVCLKVCLSALFWAVCAFEERSRARLNPDR